MHLLEGPIEILLDWMVEYPERSADICNGRVDIDVMRWYTRLPGVVKVNELEGGELKLKVLIQINLFISVPTWGSSTM